MSCVSYQGEDYTMLIKSQQPLTYFFDKKASLNHGNEPLTKVSSPLIESSRTSEPTKRISNSFSSQMDETQKKRKIDAETMVAEKIQKKAGKGNNSKITVDLTNED
jgi:hypothetical protein